MHAVGSLVIPLDRHIVIKAFCHHLTRYWERCDKWLVQLAVSLGLLSSRVRLQFCFLLEPS